MNINTALSKATEFSDICPFALNAKPYVSFWGQRRITIPGYEGSAPIGALEIRVRELLIQKRLRFTEEEISHGTFIANQIEKLCSAANEITKTKNCFAQLLNGLFHDNYIFFPPLNPCESSLNDRYSLPMIFRNYPCFPSNHSNHWNPILTNPHLRTVLASANSLADLCRTVADAKPYMSFWGNHCITVPGYRGSILMEDLEHRVEELVEKNPHFNEEERSHGSYVINELSVLETIVEHVDRNVNAFPFWISLFRKITTLIYNILFENCSKINIGPEPAGLGSVFGNYTKEQFEAATNKPLPNDIDLRVIWRDRLLYDPPQEYFQKTWKVGYDKAFAESVDEEESSRMIIECDCSDESEGIHVTLEQQPCEIEYDTAFEKSTKAEDSSRALIEFAFSEEPGPETPEQHLNSCNAILSHPKRLS